MKNSNERNPGNAQQKPADQAQQAQGGNSSTPFTKAEPKPQSKPMVGNVTEPMQPDLRSEQGDRRVNPQRSAS